MIVHPTLRIVIATHGFVFVGNYSRSKNEHTLSNANCIRRWGTQNGLGELALFGPTTETILEPCGDVELPRNSVVATIKCLEEKWRKHGY